MEERENRTRIGSKLRLRRERWAHSPLTDYSPEYEIDAALKACEQNPNSTTVHPMTNAAKIAVGLIALLHVYIMVLEMFLWTKPAGLRAFGTKPDFAEASKILAANQGLYNGFLGAGLFWSLTFGAAGRPVAIFFLSCVIVAGLYGAATANKKILFVQAIPGGLALLVVLLT